VDDDLDEVLDAYDWDEEPDEPFTDGPFKGKFLRLSGPFTGIIWYCEADDGQGEITAHMVGDDRSEEIDANYVVAEVDDDDVCSCGQDGCSWSPNGIERMS